MKRSRQEIKAELKAAAKKVRKKVVDIFGNYARDINFSFLELFSVLFHSAMKHDIQNPGWLGRDRLIISDLKVMPSLLAVLAELGYISWKECHDLIIQLPKFFSAQGISLVKYPGVEFIVPDHHAGMVHALGEALMGQKSRTRYRVYHVLPDKRNTRLQEILMTTSAVKMKNLTTIIPFLEMQRRPATIQFWFSMGWQLEEVRFEDTSSIFEGFYRANKAREKPQVILG